MKVSTRASGWVLGAVVALVFGHEARPEPTFTEVVKSWSELSLKESRPVRGVALSAGHGQFKLTNGDAAYVVAGGATVGIYFRGEGALEYVSVDPVEFPVLQWNVKKNTGLKADVEAKSVTLRDSFTEILWLAGSSPMPQLPTEGEGRTLVGPFSAHVKKFGRVESTPVGHMFASWRLNAPDRSLVRAEISGGDEDLLYLYDGFDQRSESLSMVKGAFQADMAISDRLYCTVLSDQPIGRDRRDPLQPAFLLSDVDLSVTATDGENLTMTATETFRAISGTPRVLLLDLYNTRFAYGRLGKLEPHSLRIKGIYDESGQVVPFDHASGEVAIGLRAPLQRGVPLKLRFEIEGDILFRPDGDSYWELGVEPWFPQPDLSGQYYTVHCTVKVKKPFVPFAPGKTIRRATEGDFNILETRVEKPVQFMVILAGKYSFEEETRNGVTIRIASYGGKNSIGIRKLMKLAGNVIEYYTGFLGPFPFDEFNILEINAWGYGQAPPGFMFITSEAFNPIGGEVNQLFSGGVNERFAHEIAHQYWGHAVKMPSGDEQWLTESFAEISAGLCIRELRGKGDFEVLRTTWKSQGKSATASAPIPLANRLRSRVTPETAYTNRTSLLYSKGPWLLDVIRRDIGERPFLVFLSSCQSTYLWKFGNTKGFLAVLEAVAKKEWGPFFEENYWGTGMPN